MVDFYGKLVGKYTIRPMDPMGMAPSRRSKQGTEARCGTNESTSNGADLLQLVVPRATIPKSMPSDTQIHRSLTALLINGMR